MRLEITPELIEAITKAVRAWKRDTIPHEEEDQHFDTFCEEEHGLRIDFVSDGHAVMIQGAEVLDEDKYIDFLLRYGNMHDD